MTLFGSKITANSLKRVTHDNEHEQKVYSGSDAIAVYTGIIVHPFPLSPLKEFHSLPEVVYKVLMTCSLRRVLMLESGDHQYSIKPKHEPRNAKAFPSGHRYTGAAFVFTLKPNSHTFPQEKKKILIKT